MKRFRVLREPVPGCSGADDSQAVAAIGYPPLLGGGLAEAQVAKALAPTAPGSRLVCAGIMRVTPLCDSDR